MAFGDTVATVTNPSFVKTSADNKNLYAVSELGPNDGEAGFVYSYKINDDHSLEELGRISTESYAPCHIAEDRKGKYIFVANYMGGVVMMYEKKADGSLEKKQKIVLENPEKSHPHSVNISEDNKTVYVTDLGNDRIWIFNLNEIKGLLEPHKNPFIQLIPGAGPRHFAFSNSFEYAYSINELNGSVSAFKLRNSGELEHIMDISSLPENFDGENSSADIHIHPSGKFLYASNRGHDSIVTFKIDEETGKLETVGFTSTEGKAPRNFAISPGGDFLYVANQNTHNIVAFRINSETGLPRSMELELEVKSPVCIEFLN
ncbi:lactonase family protein [Antarcticibacterium sp. 1MA-6-2]|uniref:lactonase family protein n=1 Tax=Antarcticibacterium sp. 1MA-6-2 TaxID=2908210 RepID=UPI001F191510|nr:lactonase family protein [Antarcticibacterium sp. 1MA-6-2]UJH91755.1 lactonase family protein [Antarcticibacterium sp. 1MA-6-2]